VTFSFLAIELSSGGDIQSSSSTSGSTASLNNEEEIKTNASTTAPTTTAPIPTTPELKVENNPDGGVWITSQGVFYFKLNTLHIHLQYFYSTLKVNIEFSIIQSKFSLFFFLLGIRSNY
jgi:hypothetical protein